MLGCPKRYTDPSSLRKHVKNHTREEQQQYRRVRERINAQKQCQQQQQQQQQTMPEEDAWQDSSTTTTTTFASHHAILPPPPLLAVGLQAGGTVVDVRVEVTDAARDGDLFKDARVKLIEGTNGLAVENGKQALLNCGAGQINPLEK